LFKIIGQDYLMQLKMSVLPVHQTFLSDDNANGQKCPFYRYIRHSCLMIMQTDRDVHFTGTSDILVWW